MTLLDLSALSCVISSQFPEVAFAYLFGSSKGGRVKKGSDVDIAVYYTGQDIFVRLSVEEALEKAFPDVVFDIVEIQKADPVLSFEALSGSQLFVRPEATEVYLDFYTRTCRLYEDCMYWRRKQLEYRGYEVQWGD
jgi:predicted nucleotidyltransferase